MEYEKNTALDNFNLLLYFCMNWASYIYMTFWRVQINETNATFNHILYGTIFNWYVNDEYNCYICKRNNSRLAENAKAAILIDRDTGKIIYEKNMDEQLPPASMTKIMTLLLVMAAIDTGELSYDEKILISENESSMGGSQVFLEVGEEITVIN